MSNDESVANLGPLARLAGVWEGDAGVDHSPSATRELMETPFRERAVFEPMGRVDNHEQVLWALRYSTTAWRLDEAGPFHEEVGYWLWDGANGQVMSGFVVPRGVTVLAGGSASASDRQLQLAAELGSPTYGISSNLFLDAEFKTVRYELEVDLREDDVFAYAQDTQMEMPGRPELFHHRDSNRLRRVG